MFKRKKDPDQSTIRTAVSGATSYHTANSDGTVTPRKSDAQAGSRFRESDSVMNPQPDESAGPAPDGTSHAPKAVDQAVSTDPAQPAIDTASPVSYHADKAPSYTAPEGHALPADAKRQSMDEKRTLNGAQQDGTSDGTDLPPSAVGTFAAGAGTSGPRAPPDTSLHGRAATAELGLGADVKRQLTKREAKDAKRMSKILKNEAKTEEKSLSVAIKELERLQKVQRKAASAESDALSKHTKATRIESKLNQSYLAAKTAWERAAAELKARAEALEASREHAKQQTEMLRQKTAEVDRLRAQKATDDRERQAKIAALTSPGV